MSSAQHSTQNSHDNARRGSSSNEKEVENLSPQNSNKGLQDEQLQSGSTWTQELLRKILANLTVRIENLRLRYVQGGRVFLLESSLCEFVATDSEWKQSFVDLIGNNLRLLPCFYLHPLISSPFWVYFFLSYCSMLLVLFHTTLSSIKGPWRLLHRKLNVVGLSASLWEGSEVSQPSRPHDVLLQPITLALRVRLYLNSSLTAQELLSVYGNQAPSVLSQVQNAE